MKEWRQTLTNSQTRLAFPIMTYPGLALTGRGIQEMISNGRTQFECLQAIAQTYPMAAASTTMDLSVEAQAFGSSIRFSDEEVPTVQGRLVTDAETIERLQVPQVGSARSAVYLEAAKLASEAIMDRPVFGGMIGPFSLAGRLYGMTEIMMDLMLEPETIHPLMEKCALFLKDYAMAFKAAGANGVIVAEPAAGLLSPAQAEAFSSQYVARIVSAVQDDQFMLILHNCGNTKKLIPTMVGTGAAGLHFGNAVDMAEILPEIAPDRVVFGNVDPASVLRHGSAELVQRVTSELLARTAAFPNYVLSSGCDVAPGTPIENINAFFRALDEHNNKLTVR